MSILLKLPEKSSSTKTPRKIICGLVAIITASLKNSEKLTRQMTQSLKGSKQSKSPIKIDLPRPRPTNPLLIINLEIQHNSSTNQNHTISNSAGCLDGRFTADWGCGRLREIP
jgi:hypothetical protein